MISPDFSKCSGLIPVIVKACITEKVLMLRWMNEEAWKETVEHGYAVYYSRSRHRPYKYGGATGRLVHRVCWISLDPGGNAVLLKVAPEGLSSGSRGADTSEFIPKVHFMQRWDSSLRRWRLDGPSYFGSELHYSEIDRAL